MLLRIAKHGFIGGQSNGAGRISTFTVGEFLDFKKRQEGKI
jgi:hypothetical protein